MTREEQLNDALDRMGGTHNLADILDEIKAGTMQSWVSGETWAVTKIVQFPRKKLLEVVLVIGDLDDAVKLHEVVLEFAAHNNCDMIRTFARDGWHRWAKTKGWANGMRIYVKEM